MHQPLSALGVSGGDLVYRCRWPCRPAFVGSNRCNIQLSAAMKSGAEIDQNCRFHFRIANVKMSWVGWV